VKEFLLSVFGGLAFIVFIFIFIFSVGFISIFKDVYVWLKDRYNIVSKKKARSFKL